MAEPDDDLIDADDLFFALNEAEESFEQRELARSEVRRLMNAFHSAVQRRTQQRVAVSMEPKSNFRERRHRTNSELAMESLVPLLGGHVTPERKLGDDKEDQSVRSFAVARNDTQSRLLWEILIPPHGWPVTLYGPASGFTTDCHDATSLNGWFMQAASSGLVMAKIKALDVEKSDSTKSIESNDDK